MSVYLCMCINIVHEYYFMHRFSLEVVYLCRKKYQSCLTGEQSTGNITKNKKKKKRKNKQDIKQDSMRYLGLNNNGLR